MTFTKLKRDDEKPVMYKTYLVVKGSEKSKLVCFFQILGLAITDLEHELLNVIMDFLHSSLMEDVYMVQLV